MTANIHLLIAHGNWWMYCQFNSKLNCRKTVLNSWHSTTHWCRHRTYLDDLCIWRKSPNMAVGIIPSIFLHVHMLHFHISLSTGTHVWTQNKFPHVFWSDSELLAKCLWTSPFDFFYSRLFKNRLEKAIALWQKPRENPWPCQITLIFIVPWLPWQAIKYRIQYKSSHDEFPALGQKVL